MSWVKPTLPDLIDRITADFVARLAITGQPLAQSVIRKVSRVWANAVNGLHGHLAWGVQQYFIKDADADNLVRHGNELDLPPLAATFGHGLVVFTVASATTIPAGRLLQRSDGVQYQLDADVVALSAGTVTGSITASVAGASANAPTGVTLTLSPPVAYVTPAASVGAGGITGGADSESSEHYRARLLDRKRNTPQGGAIVDYVKWARAASPLVTRVWVVRGWMGPGTVGVLFVCDGLADIIPSDALVQQVQNFIDGQDIRPVTADVYVVAPTPLLVDHTIQLQPNTSAVQSAVTAELKDFYVRETSPGGLVALSNIDEAISLAEGEISHVLIEPAAAIEPAQYQLPLLGNVAFV